MANISAIKLPNGVTYDIKDDSSGYITGMTILSYGSSTWDNFIEAYNANKVVYCRASSNSNPASGSQTRLAFMTYVNNATAPTNVEFQYYRSVSSHTASQQGDQVYVYKLDKTSGWSVTTREASVKVVAGTGLGGTYSNGTMTLTGPTKVSDLTNDSGFITGYTETDPVFSASAAHGITSSDITNWNGKQAALVSGTNIKTINGNSILGSGNMDIAAGVSDVQSDGVSVVTNGVANIDTFGKSTSSTAGKKGLVPAPYASEYLEQVFLTATGYWATESFSKEIANSTQRLKRQIKVNDAVEHNWRITFDNATTSVSGFMSPSDKTKLDGIASGAEVNVQSDWNQSDSTADDYIKNKPTNATTSANGLMSSTDKSKLDGIESGAEVNYVTKITQHFIADPNDSQYVYPRSATLDYNAVGINDVELLTKDALGEFNGVCDLDASSKVPKSRLPSTSTPTADEVSEFDSSAHMNSTDMTAQALETYVDSLDIQGSVFVDATDVPTAGEIAKFDSTANMSSTDMTTGSGSELEDFINGLDVSGKLTHTTDKFYNTAITISAGTAGTYATYQTIDISKTGYKPIGILNTYVGHGGSYLPFCFFTGTTLYINFYRVGPSAYNVPAEDMSIIILYEKE